MNISIKNLTVKAKLFGGFGIAVLALIAMTALNISTTKRLGQMQDAAFERSKAETNASFVRRDDYKLYGPIANTIINRDFDKAATDWAFHKKEVAEEIAQMVKDADTAEEKTWAKQASDAFAAICDKYENDILIDAKSSTGITDEIRKCDAELDVMMDAMHKPAKLFAKSLAEESVLADKEFDAARKAAERTSLAISALAILMLIGAAVWITSGIVKSLSVLKSVSERVAEGDIDVVIDTSSKDEIGELSRAMGAMVESIQGTSMAADMIAAGDLSIDITPKSDKDVLSVSMMSVITSLRGLVEETSTLTQAAVDGRLDARGDSSKFQGGYHDIVQGVNDTLDTVIGPLNVAAEYVERISKGDIPEPITDDYNGDFNEIKNNLNTMVRVMSDLLGETDKIVTAAADGRLDIRADAGMFEGGWNQLVSGINDTVTNIVDPLNVTADYVDKVSKGIIPPVITTEYKGQYNVIKTNLNTMVKMMSELLEETDKIVIAAADGQLDTRADASKFEGGWNQLVSGVNDTITNIVEPLNVTADYVDKVSKGIIPPVITTEYKGQYNVIKTNLNTMVKMMSELLEETDKIVTAAADGQLDTRADASKFEGGWNQLVSGVNDTITNIVEPLNVTADYVDKVSKGVIPPVITTDYNGQYDIIKGNLNTMVQMMSELLEETDKLVAAADNGELDVRADAGKFEGGWHQLVSGFNDTITNIVGPLNVSAEYVERISKGDIPELITDEYHGDFNEIKNNLNACINAVDAMAADTNALIQDSLAGKLGNRADVSKHQGDYAKIVGGINEMLDAIILPVNEAAEVLVRLADNDLTARVVGEYDGDHAKIKDSLNSACEALEQTIIQAGKASSSVANTAKDLASTANEVGRASQSVAETINQVASGSQEQTKMVTSASSSMEQLSQAIDEVAKGAQSQAKTVEDTVQLVQQIAMAIESVAKTAQSAAGASQEVAEVARQGGDSVEKSVAGMARIKDTSANVAMAVVQLGENSKQIGAIVETIDDIAEQTNLLALNAAIEAARAGEHGKGFAVVADEVRKLAERSSLATKEIADLIGKIQQMTEHAVEAMQAGTSEVEEGTELANQAGEALGSIVEAVNSIVQQIEDVSAATEEMSASSAEVAKAVESLSAVTEESTAATEEMAATASEVTRSVEQVAAVSEENAASAEEVSAAAQEQNASVEEMSASAGEVAKIADDLMAVVSAFKVNGGGSAGRMRIEESAKKAA